jgi:TolB-like protein
MRQPTAPVDESARGRRRVAIGVAAVIGAALVATGIVRWAGGGNAGAPAGTAADRTDAMVLALDRVLRRGGADAAPGLAIRPLADAAADADTTALAEGVCANLAERLARLPSLRVVPCRSTTVAAAAELDDRRLARLLAVRWVLKGRLEARGSDKVRVTLALHEATTDRSAWRIDEEIASAGLQGLPMRVAQATGVALGQPDTLAPEATIAPELYAKYLRARQLANRVSIEDRLKALALLDEVLAEAPDHASSLYIRQNLRGRLLGNMPGRQLNAAELDAARAVNVAEGLALAQRLSAADPFDFRGQVLLLADELEVKRWPAGYDRIDRIVEHHARVPGLMRLAARLYLHAGYVTRARELALAAAQFNALDGEAIEILAAIAGIEGRDAELRELLALARQIGHQGLGPIQMFEAFRRRDWAAIERDYAAYVGWGGKWPADWVPAYVRGLAQPAERGAALAMLDGHDAATRQHFSSYFIEYMLLGDADRSLRSVRHHARRAPASWMQYLWWPEMAPVRRHAEFGAAMRDLGAAALWDVRGAPDLCSRAASGEWQCR